MEPVMELRQYYEVFRKRAWMIALIVVLAVGGVVTYLASQPPQYQAEVSMLVTPRIIAPAAFDESSTLQGQYRETMLNNTLQLLRSRALRQRVAERVGGMSAEQVTVKDLRGTDFIIISAKDASPGRAALIANTMAQELVDFYVDINRTEAASSRKFIAEQLSLSQNRLSVAERALLEFRTRAGNVALTEEVSRMVNRSLDMQAAYDGAMLDERIARTRIASIQSRLRSQNDARLASVSIATNPVIAQIRDHLTGLELELTTLRQVYTDQHPKVQAMLGRVADARQRLSAEAAKVVNDQSLGTSPIRESFVREMITAEVEAAAARAKAAGITQILGRVQSQLNSMPTNELTFVRLQRDVRIAEQLFTRLSSLHQEAVIRESKASSAGQAAMVVVDIAKAPQMPVANQLPMRATFAGLLGLFLGAALALCVESLDDRIRSSRQAEGAYGVPVLAAIPRMNSRSYRHLTEAPAVATLLFPVILVLLLVGAVVAGLYVGQAGAVSDHVIRFGETLAQVFRTVR